MVGACRLSGSGPTMSSPGTAISSLSLLDRHLRLTARDERAGQAARDDRGLGVDRIGDAELSDQPGEEDAAGAEARVDDRRRRQQRILERLRRADVGPRRARLDGQAHQRAAKVDGGAAVQDAEPDELVGARPGDDRDVRGLARLDTRDERIGRGIVDGHRAAMPGLEALNERDEGALDGVGGEDLQHRSLGVRLWGLTSRV